jgi:AcrR family transcriptional regulator
VARTRFKTAGYDAVTIESIASDAEVSAVTVYNYYGSKAGLLLALVKESDELLIEQLRQLIDNLPEDIREAIARFGQVLRHHALTYLTKPTWRQVLAASIIEGNDTFGRTYSALDRVLIELMSELVAAYQARSALRHDIDAGVFGDTLFSLQNIRFIQFISDDASSDEIVDAKFRADLKALFDATES